MVVRFDANVAAASSFFCRPIGVVADAAMKMNDSGMPKEPSCLGRQTGPDPAPRGQRAELIECKLLQRRRFLWL
jgi:hypothetical protein